MAAMHYCFMLFVLTVLADRVACGGNKLMLFLVDGFRWDYFEKPNMKAAPGFGKLLRGGSKALCLEPINPTNSYPNYYSLMTGKYCFHPQFQIKVGVHPMIKA